MNYSNLIHQLCKDFRLSIQDLAKKSGISAPTLSRIANGVTAMPYPSTIHALEAALNISINDSDNSNISYTDNSHISIINSDVKKLTIGSDDFTNQIINDINAEYTGESMSSVNGNIKGNVKIVEAPNPEACSKCQVRAAMEEQIKTYKEMIELLKSQLLSLKPPR